MTTIHLGDEDSLKSLRETLCVAQAALPIAYADAPLAETDAGAIERFGRQLAHSERLGRLIAEIDRQRPLGPDGQHGDRHTVTCGCLDKPSVSEGTGHVWPCTRFYVAATTTDPCTCWKGRA